MLMNFLFIKLFLKQQISILISEGSCDTEDWSNDAENYAISKINKKLILKLLVISYFKM